MIQLIKDYFDQYLQVDCDNNDIQHSINIAAAALLFEVAKSDFKMQDEELLSIKDLLQKELILEENELLKLIEFAKKESKESVSLHEFTTLVHQNYTLEQKIELFKQLWTVAYADDRLDKYEEHLLRKIADLIYLPHQHFIQTKQFVLKSRVLSENKN